MKRAIFAAALISIGAAAAVYADEHVLVLKNGRRVRGELVERTATEYVLATPGGKVRIATASVGRVERVAAERRPAEPRPAPVASPAVVAKPVPAPAKRAPDVTPKPAPAVAADAPRPASPGPRRAVVLLRAGPVFEAVVLEGASHLHVKLPEGELSVRLREVREVFRYADARLDPPEFESAVRTPAAFEALLAKLDLPLQNGLLLRALLRPDGREAADAYARTHHREALLGLLQRWAKGTEAAREAEKALEDLRHVRRFVTIRDGEQVLELQVEERPSQNPAFVVIHVPEASIRLPRTSVELGLPIAATRGGDAGFEDALASKEAFAEYLGSVSASEAQVALLRALLRDDGRKAAAAGDPGLRLLMLRLIAAGCESAAPAESAAEALARAGQLEPLEPALVDMVKSRTPWRRRLGLRGLVTLAGTEPTRREERFAGWAALVGRDPSALAALHAAFEHDDAVLEMLAGADDERRAQVLHVLAESRRAFRGDAVMLIAQDLAKPELARAAVQALAASDDGAQVEPLVALLAELERRGGAPALRREVQLALGALTRSRQPRTPAEWADEWTGRQGLLAAALARATSAEVDAAGRIAAWNEIAEAGSPTLEVRAALAGTLGAARDGRVLEAALDAVVRLKLVDAQTGRLLVGLLAREEPRALAHATLLRLYGGTLPPTATSAWLELVNQNAFAPPFRVLAD